jgi:hypothetical protein
MPSFLADLLQALAAWPIAAYFRASTVGYATLNGLHILSIALLVGAIATLDLRMLGVFRSAPLSGLAYSLSRVAAAGVALSIVTGALLFAVRPIAYAENPAFLAKVSLVALGVVNALALRANRHWRAAREGGPLPDSVRLQALLSLLIWTAAIFAGRWIGFLQ